MIMYIVELLHRGLCVFIGLALAGLIVGTPAVWSFRSYLFRCWFLALVGYGAAAYFIIFRWSY